MKKMEFIKDMFEYGVGSIEAIKEANRYYEQAATTYNTIKKYGTKE